MAKYFIGWDVGAWKCKEGREDSCDAIVLIEGNEIVGFKRQRISSTLNSLHATPKVKRQEWLINSWFDLCGIKARFSQTDQFVLAIDTPLGWPNDFKKMMNGVLSKDWIYSDDDANLRNTLLFRYTEREKLGGALSVIVDSIGSQSVKGLALLEILDAKESSWGVWKSGNLTLIETYPKACLVRPEFVEWMRGLKLKRDLTRRFRKKIKGGNPTRYENVEVIAEDLFDATICSCVAKAYDEGAPNLVKPTKQDPVVFKPEGWVFFPNSATNGLGQSAADKHWKTTCREGIRSFHDALGEFQKYVASKTTNA